MNILPAGAARLNSMPFLCARFSLRRQCRRALPFGHVATLTGGAFAQQPTAPVAAQTTPVAPAAITLDGAITRARANEPNFATAVAASKNAALDRSIARAALLPNISYFNQYLYTESNHGPTPNKICAASSGVDAASVTAPAPVRFIANNTVHEYLSQGQVNETIGAQEINAVSRASASLAVATAEVSADPNRITGNR